jgi:hypothetical protein
MVGTYAAPDRQTRRLRQRAHRLGLLHGCRRHWVPPVTTTRYLAKRRGDSHDYSGAHLGRAGLDEAESETACRRDPNPSPKRRPARGAPDANCLLQRPNQGSIEVRGLARPVSASEGHVPACLRADVWRMWGTPSSWRGGPTRCSLLDSSSVFAYGACSEGSHTCGRRSVDDRKEGEVREPETKLDARFSDPDAVATEWEETRRVLESAELFWISTVRADGARRATAHAATTSALGRTCGCWSSKTFGVSRTTSPTARLGNGRRCRLRRPKRHALLEPRPQRNAVLLMHGGPIVP